jgi:hypothetical protein
MQPVSLVSAIDGLERRTLILASLGRIGHAH